MQHLHARTQIRTHRSLFGRFTGVALAIAGSATLAAAQSPITWLPVRDIAGPKDVATSGDLVLAVNLGPETCATVVNGVHFQADRGHWAPKIMLKGGPVVRGVMYWPDFHSGGYTLKMPWMRANGMGPGQTTDPAYNLGLSTGKHIRPGNHAHTNTITGLTPGKRYMIQLWVAHKDPKLVEWDNGVGGREGKGGIFMTTATKLKGQVATGLFTASSNGIQTFTCHDQDADSTTTPPLKATWGLLNMIQVREISPSPRTASATHYGLGTKGTQRGGRGGEYGGTNCAPAIRFVGHPVLGSKVSLTVENSVGAPTAAAIVFGGSAAKIPALGGELLVVPAVVLVAPMPFTVTKGNPFVQDHELQIPFTLPKTPATVYVQALQLDSGATGGWSMTAGIKIRLGT